MKRAEPAIKRFSAYLKRRNYAAHTIVNYTLDLRLFFADQTAAPAQITYREIDAFVDKQLEQGLAATTRNRRLHALRHFFEFLLEEQEVAGNPVKASHFARLGRPLPRALSKDQVEALFAQVKHPMDKALFLIMLRGGLRVSEAVHLKRQHLDFDEGAVWIEQGKGKKDRRVLVSADTVASLKACLELRPKGVPSDAVFWNRKRPLAPLNVKAVQKKMERCAQAAGIKVTCQQLRHTFASNLLEHGAELVTVKELLGHASMGTSERYARVSNQRVKQEYMRTMKKVLKDNKI